ncbi:MAG: DNA-processing protein DprA [Bryobacteraceae bacterium]|nr:DNA-processing protein DprA [Bryobacteraceae bacterium]
MRVLSASATILYVIPAEEELHWLALIMVPGVGPRTVAQLLSRFKSPVEVFRAAADEIEDCGVSGSTARTIASGCTFEDAVGQQEKLRAEDAVLITLRDSIYPARLREIYDPPPVLFARGRTELLATVMIGVVGTRRPTTYGIAATTRLSSDLASAQITIVSGMARGIDTAAHKAALEATGNTVAVFGCGIDLVYPAENRRLAATIAEKGLVLSELPMSTPPYPQNFPVRNRIVSGMSAGILVVEGAQYSGSGITARLAMDQQREVFAVPGNITSKMSWGPNLLIKQGAKLVQEWNDVVVELQPEDRKKLVAATQRQLGLESFEPSGASQGVPGETVSPQAKLARELLGKIPVDAPVHLDALMESLLHVSPSEVIAALFELELEGAVRQLPGKNFVKVW